MHGLTAHCFSQLLLSQFQVVLITVVAWIKFQGLRVAVYRISVLIECRVCQAAVKEMSSNNLSPFLLGICGGYALFV